MEISCWRISEVVPELYKFGNLCIVTTLRSNLATFLSRRGRSTTLLSGITSNPTIYCLSPFDGYYGPLSIMSSDVHLFRREGVKISLQLNVGFCTILPSDASLLSAPLIGLSSSADRALEARCSDLRAAIITGLKSICAVDALILPSSINAPKLLHTLRCTSCDSHPLLGTHDDLLREGISAIRIILLRWPFPPVWILPPARLNSTP